MQDKEVPIRAVIVIVMWVLGVSMVVANLLLPEDVKVGQLGLVTVGGAMVLQIRGYFCGMHKRLTDVFQMGREFERGADKVRALR